VPGSARVTALAMLAILDVGGSDKRIEHRVGSLYDTGDADSSRAMGTMLGPSIVDSNAIHVLHVVATSVVRSPTRWQAGRGQACRCTSCAPGCDR